MKLWEDDSVSHREEQHLFSALAEIFFGGRNNDFHRILSLAILPALYVNKNSQYAFGIFVSLLGMMHKQTLLSLHIKFKVT